MEGTLNVCSHLYIEHKYVYAQDTHTCMHKTHWRVCTEHTHTCVYTEHKHIYTLVYRHKEGEGDWGFAWILIFCYFLNSFFSLGFLCVALEPVLKLACGPGRPRTHRDPTTSASQVLGFLFILIWFAETNFYCWWEQFIRFSEQWYNGIHLPLSHATLWLSTYTRSDS